MTVPAPKPFADASDRQERTTSLNISTSRLPDDIESRIFDLLLHDNKRQTCGTITLLSKDHHRRFAPRFWHTVIIDSSSGQRISDLCDDDNTAPTRSLIKRVVFSDPPPGAAFWDKDINRAPPTPRERFPNLEQVILTRAFTVHYALELFEFGYTDPPDEPALHWSMGFFGLARSLIMAGGPGLSVLWDLDFPYTAKYWYMFTNGQAPRQVMGQTLPIGSFADFQKAGAIRGMITQLLEGGQPTCDAELSYGVRSHIKTLTLLNYHCLQRLPADLYCDVLHVVMSPYALSRKHAVGYFGNKVPFIVCEHTLEYVLEVNANKVLVQGLEGVDDAEVRQAAHEVVEGYNRGGERTEQRVADKVRFGPRHGAMAFVQLLFPPGGAGLPLDLDVDAYDRSTRSRNAPRIPSRLPEPFLAAYKPTEKGHFALDIHTAVDWLVKPHDYQLSPDFTGYYDPHKSFWECQQDDPLPTYPDDAAALQAGDMLAALRHMNRTSGVGSMKRGKMNAMYKIRRSGIVHVDGFQ